MDLLYSSLADESRHKLIHPLGFIFLTIGQGIELVPPNIEIPQGTEAAQLHGKGLQLIAAHVLGQRRHYKPRIGRNCSAISLWLLAFSPSLFSQGCFLPFSSSPPPEVPGAWLNSPSSGPCPLFSQAAAGFLRC